MKMKSCLLILAVVTLMFSFQLCNGECEQEKQEMLKAIQSEPCKRVSCLINDATILHRWL